MPPECPRQPYRLAVATGLEGTCSISPASAVALPFCSITRSWNLTLPRANGNPYFSAERTAPARSERGIACNAASPRFRADAEAAAQFGPKPVCPSLANDLGSMPARRPPATSSTQSTGAVCRLSPEHLELRVPEPPCEVQGASGEERRDSPRNCSQRARQSHPWCAATTRGLVPMLESNHRVTLTPGKKNSDPEISRGRWTRPTRLTGPR
jgi:hypothetical protein